MSSRPKISPEQLRRWYRLMSVRMTDIDCGRLCAPKNEGIPYCCDQDSVVPLLYRDEYRWHRGQDRFWKKMQVRTAEHRRLIKDTHPYNVFAECPGPGQCSRGKRALVCRMFPFEPYVDKEGNVLGLVYQDERKDGCPLIGKPKSAYNPKYLANSIRFWQEVLDSLPHERELYMGESRKRDRRAKRAGQRLRIIR